MLRSRFRSISSIKLEEVTGEKNIYHKDSIYTKILDEDIILEEELTEESIEETGVVFVYEEFMEYVMAREIFKREKLYYKNEEEIFKVIEGLINDIDKFSTIFGILVYLGLILKKVKELSVWKLLIKRGTKCQEVIFESIRKLPTKEIDESVFDVLEGLVLSGENETRKKVLEILLSKIFMDSDKEAVIRILGILINDGNWEIRKKTAKALGQIGSDKAVLPLIQALNDQISIVRVIGIKSLIEIGSEKAIEPLICALKEDNIEVRSMAAEGLGRLKSEKIVEPLISALENDNIAVKRSAVKALGKIKTEKAIESLINCLGNDDLEVRINVLDALEKLNWKPKNLKEKANYLIAKQKWKECVKVGEPALESLINALSFEYYVERASSAKVLGEIKSEKAVEPLICALKDSHSDVIENAAEALGKIKSEKAVDPLINALKNKKSVEGRSSAAKALGEIQSEKAVDPLIKAMGDDYSEVRVQAAWALGEMKSKKAIEPLIKALRDKDYEVGWCAVEALKKIGTAKALKAVKEYA